MSDLARWTEAEKERMENVIQPLCDALILLMSADALTDHELLAALENAWRAGKRDAHNAPTIPASATGYRMPGGPADVVPQPRRRR